MEGLPIEAIVVAAVGAIVAPLAFVALVIALAVARRRGRALPGWTSSVVALVAGLALGSMALVTLDAPLVILPFGVVAAGIAVAEWRRRHAVAAASVIVGFALPWTALWGCLAIAGVLAGDTRSSGIPRLLVEPGAAARNFALGALPIAIALLLAGAADPGNAAPARAGAPPPPPHEPPRSFRTLARALREPSRIGPIGLPELAAVAAWVATGLVVPLLPLRGSPLATVAIAAIAGSALASEGYLRALAPSTRRATEAFLWLGSWEARQVRASLGEGLPTTARAARRWLARHPMTADEPVSARSLRVQLLLMAGEVDGAFEAAASRPFSTTPDDAFAIAADRELVAWWRGDEGDLEALDRAAAAIQPAGEDDQLRAMVAVATARVRRNAVAVPAVADPLAPLVAIRARLGGRADGILRRVLGRRLFRVFLSASAVLGVAGWLLGGAVGI